MTLEAVRAELQALAEPDYAAFSAKLLPGTGGILGVRLPKLRALAKQLAGEGEPLLEALDSAPPESFEETMLYGMLVGAVKMPDEERLYWMERFVPRVGNWSVCDSFCVSCKAAGKNRPFYRDFIERMLGSGKEYPVRCGLVLMLDWYLVPEEIDFDTEAFYGHGGQPSCGFEESYGHMHDNDFGHDYDYDDFNDEEDY